MNQTLFFNKLPIPSLIINELTGHATSNIAFIDYFGKPVSSISDWKSLYIEGFPSDFSKPIANSEGVMKKSAYELINVLTSLQPLSDGETIITIQPLVLSFEVFLKQAKYREALSELPLGVIIKNTSTDKTIWISPYLIQKTGYSFDDISSKAWQELTYIEDIAKQENLMQQMNEHSGHSFVLEKRIVAKSGKIYWFYEYVSYFKIEQNTYQIVLLRDISVEKENEIELMRAKQKVEEAERLKTAFLDNMPHEIRTPLHAITGFTSLLSDSGLTHNERLEYVKFIQDSSNDILNLIDNIIEIAKLETNQIKPKKDKCYINSIFDKLYSDFVSKQMILEKSHINLKMVKADSDPLFMIFSDPERLHQILTHLLNNALKFTEKGEIEFGYHLPHNGKIEFYVKDTGIGIPQDQLQIIFKKFGKSGNINTNKNRGSGLGLTLSKKIIELMNGEITVQSAVNEGSLFSFHLPVETETKITIVRPSVLGEMNWNAKTILVAEDTESNYFFIEAFLERTNVNLLWAQDGLEAVEIFREKNKNINLVLMDIMMPEMDGYDATRELKSINPDIPIIAQTALALPDDEEKCYDVGCDYVLVKPINSEDLIATIKKFIL
jgi:PAS domain S-box-containing protein